MKPSAIDEAAVDSQTAPDQKTSQGEGPIPFYPLIVAVFPVLSVFSANLSIFPLHHLTRPLLVSLMAGVLVYGFSSLPFRSLRRGAAAAAVVLTGLWSWTAARDILWSLLGKIPAVSTMIVLGVILALAAAKWGPRAGFLNLVSFCVASVSLFSLFWNATHPPRPKLGDALQDVVELPPGPRPDIYHFVLDGFGSQESLKGSLGVNLDWFFDGLRERGFQVADEARANYVQTELSLASTLNFDYVPNLLPQVDRNEKDRRVLSDLIGRSASMKKLIKSGYRFSMIGTGFPSLQFGRYEVKAPSDDRVTLFEGTLLEMTPWQASDKVVESQYVQHYRDLVSAFNWLESNAKPTSQPRMTFVHVLAPHPPFVVDGSGAFTRPKGPYGLWDGSDFIAWAGDERVYREGYANKAAFAGRRILSLIDALFAANAKNPPIIMLHGDHGSKLGLDQNSLAKTDLNESFPILYALSLPPGMKSGFDPVETPVNLYRKVFCALGVQGLPDLEDRSWYSPFAHPFNLTEVTDKLIQSSP